MSGMAAAVGSSSLLNLGQQVSGNPGRHHFTQNVFIFLVVVPRCFSFSAVLLSFASAMLATVYRIQEVQRSVIFVFLQFSMFMSLL